ncbi:MAG: T9SS type A sorting domain-containing protein [Hymenobacteraceae bacterium]|nr:T9SS type A sorting domain-containing protein [Hymenobacteraceae bacterium]
MLKRVLLGSALLSQFAAPVVAQDRPTPPPVVRHCATPSVDQLPAAEQAVLQQIEQQTRRFIAQRAENAGTANRTSAVIVTIPVVVHVLYNTAAQNISDAIVQSQIDVLNRDYAKLNTDFSKTPTAFQGAAADMQIRFQLATKTPTGALTNGIIHKYTANTYFDYGRKDPQGVFVKQSAKGGDDAWNTSQYLNMWVCNFGGSAGGLLGYATFPSDAGTYKDGVVMGYKYFGVNPALGGVYGYGRTATHEVGHWVNLRHIWGDASCGNDLVSDTPTQSTSNYGCPTFPKRTCGNTTNGDMFMNYMDYTDDQCMVMFSAGQRDRCNALFATGGARASLLTSTGLRPTAPGTTTTAAQSRVSVFPNPTEGVATLQLNLPEAAATATLRILNMQGLPVYEQTLRNLAAGLNEAALPHLARGIYSVQVTGAGATTQVRFSVTQ